MINIRAMIVNNKNYNMTKSNPLSTGYFVFRGYIFKLSKTSPHLRS